MGDFPDKQDESFIFHAKNAKVRRKERKLKKEVLWTKIRFLI
jgi:hypothetical protein